MLKIWSVAAILVSLVLCFSNCAKMQSSSKDSYLKAHTKENFNTALRKAYLVFLKKSPSAEELKISETFIGYSQLMRQLVESEVFVKSLGEHHKSYFEMSGSDGGINYNEPANLAAYLIKENIDFRNILKADYCVDDNLNKIECAAFASTADAQDMAAGVVTTRAFLVKWEAAFNFKRTSKMFEMFACQSYPDESDAGMTVEEISETVKTFACTSGCDPKCYSCHNNMNARAALFYDFDRKGFLNFDPKPNAADGEITLRDNGEPSDESDLLVGGAIPRYKGQEVRTLKEYAHKLANSDKFQSCLSKRLTNFALGRTPDNVLQDKFNFINTEILRVGFNVKEFYYYLLTSSAYLSE